MDVENLTQTLSDLSVGPVRYYSRTSSTNEEAARWAENGAPDLSLVVADEQTAGRGRIGRRWYTPSSSGLAFSLILVPDSLNLNTLQDGLVKRSPDWKLMRLTALGAIATSEALWEAYKLPAEIKWPNDVLVNRHKVAGVLVETTWLGNRLNAIILGIGVNVTHNSLPEEIQLDFPATCIEDIYAKPVNRVELLYNILEKLLHWRTRLNSPEFMLAWEERLAFLGNWVNVISPDGTELNGQVEGLSPEGFLKLKRASREIIYLKGGEIRLRPGERASFNPI